MTRETKSTIIVEVELPVSGNWCPAEPDVGLNEGYFEDAQIDWKGPIARYMPELDKMDEIYSEQIQEALAESRQNDKDRADDRRDEAADAQMHHDRENKP